MRIFYLMSVILMLSSCSNYINKWHSDIDSEMYGDSPYRKSRPSHKKFEFYRNAANKIEQQKNRGRGTNSRYSKSLPPKVKRNYRPRVRKRFTADDLVDNSKEGSLWSGRGQDNFLFSNNRIRKTGDIVTVYVQKKLKEEITLELRKAFPTDTKKKKDEKKGSAAQSPSPQAGQAGQPTESENADKGAVYDKISGIVIEEINKDHLLIKGRKNVLYKKRKRTVEIETLVARRDVADDDSIKSDQVLESSIVVVR